MCLVVHSRLKSYPQNWKVTSTRTKLENNAVCPFCAKPGSRAARFKIIAKPPHFGGRIHVSGGKWDRHGYEPEFKVFDFAFNRGRLFAMTRKLSNDRGKHFELSDFVPPTSRRSILSLCSLVWLSFLKTPARPLFLNFGNGCSDSFISGCKTFPCNVWANKQNYCRKIEHRNRWSLP